MSLSRQLYLLQCQWVWAGRYISSSANESEQADISPPAPMSLSRQLYLLQYPWVWAGRHISYSAHESEQAVYLLQCQWVWAGSHISSSTHEPEHAVISTPVSMSLCRQLYFLQCPWVWAGSYIASMCPWVWAGRYISSSAHGSEQGVISRPVPMSLSRQLYLLQCPWVWAGSQISSSAHDSEQAVISPPVPGLWAGSHISTSLPSSEVTSCQDVRLSEAHLSHSEHSNFLSCCFPSKMIASTSHPCFNSHQELVWTVKYEGWQSGLFKTELVQICATYNNCKPNPHKIVHKIYLWIIICFKLYQKV